MTTNAAQQGESAQTGQRQWTCVAQQWTPPTDDQGFGDVLMLWCGAEIADTDDAWNDHWQGCPSCAALVRLDGYDH